MEDVGQEPVVAKKETQGFIICRVQHAITAECFKLIRVKCLFFLLKSFYCSFTGQNKLSPKWNFPIDLMHKLSCLLYFTELRFLHNLFSEEAAYVLGFTNIDKFSIAHQTFQSMYHFVPYQSYCKIDKNMDTLGKSSTCRKTISISNSNFV